MRPRKAGLGIWVLTSTRRAEAGGWQCEDQLGLQSVKASLPDQLGELVSKYK